VLYDVKKKDNAGTKWVKDLRTWWRKAGRDVELPMDGVSGATRPAGVQTLNFAGARRPGQAAGRRLQAGHRGGARSRRPRTGARAVHLAGQGQAGGQRQRQGRTGRGVDQIIQ
jgi:hypothetical protein